MATAAGSSIVGSLKELLFLFNQEQENYADSPFFNAKSKAHQFINNMSQVDFLGLLQYFKNNNIALSIFATAIFKSKVQQLEQALKLKCKKTCATNSNIHFVNASLSSHYHAFKEITSLLYQLNINIKPKMAAPEYFALFCIEQRLFFSTDSETTINASDEGISILKYICNNKHQQATEHYAALLFFCDNHILQKALLGSANHSGYLANLPFAKAPLLYAVITTPHHWLDNILFDISERKQTIDSLFEQYWQGKNLLHHIIGNITALKKLISKLSCNELFELLQSTAITKDGKVGKAAISMALSNPIALKLLMDKLPESQRLSLITDNSKQIMHQACQYPSSFMLLANYIPKFQRKYWNELLEQKDDAGNTLLHLSAIDDNLVSFVQKQYLTRISIERAMTVKNNLGITAERILEASSSFSLSC